MIECIFTIDYEIYGNGDGSLRELVYEPTQKLREIFQQAGAKLVVFVEVAEMEKIEVYNTDSTINEVKCQVKELHEQGHEIALHLHPQWYNARYDNGKWLLDYSEYNLCVLTRERVAQLVERSINYLRSILGNSNFTPLSFRAGNWLFQPTQTVQNVLVEQGIKVDSSVFKGGIQHQHGLDYRRALRNGYYWKFSDDVNMHDPQGDLLELPIHTQMVPAWKMITNKRVGLGKKSPSSLLPGINKFRRCLDFLRFRYPLKLDFCRMTLSELTSMLDEVIHEDQKNPDLFRPIVAIGHSKDLVDFEAVEAFLSHLRKKGIPVSTFADIYQKCKG